MKTHVIRLDENDDIISIQDKMMWTKMPRLLLVFPKRLQICHRKLDLLLLKRHAAKLGAQVAIVTNSRETRLFCTEFGIQAFKDTISAQREAWEISTSCHSPTRKNLNTDIKKMREALPRHRFENHSSFAIRILSFTLGMTAVVLILLVFLPSASIKLVPKLITQNLTMTVFASPQRRDQDAISMITLHTLSTTVESSQTLSASGTTVIPGEYATGIVRFENLTESFVGIPAGTILATLGNPSVRFATQEDAVLSAGIGEEMEIPIKALKAGLESNVLAGTISAIEGGLGSDLSVTNTFPLAGGTEENAPIATSDDRGLLQRTLLKKLIKECENNLKTTVPSGALYFSETQVVKVENEVYFPAEDQPGKTISLTLRLECSGLYVIMDDLLNLSKVSLDMGIPEGYSPYSKPVIVENSQPSFIDSYLKWEITVKRYLQTKIDPTAIIMLIIGSDLPTAASQISNVIVLEEPAIITVTPSWWSRIPLVPFRITVITPED